MKKWDLDNVQFDFLNNDILSDDISENIKNLSPKLPVYKILIADDDEEVHKISTLMLKDFEFEGRKIEILHAYSGQETIEICKRNSDIAILFLDVVMEKNHSGLHVIKVLREDLKYNLIRIILRTGQPGQAPEDEVIRKYDINDYRLKTELTLKRFNTTLYTALRNYRDLINIENHRLGLQKIIEASSRLFKRNSFNEFLMSILDELSNFQKGNNSMVYAREDLSYISNGFVSIERENKHRIFAATGKYVGFVGKEVVELPNYAEINKVIGKIKKETQSIYPIKNGLVIESLSKSELSNFIFVEGTTENFDFDLIKVFLSNFSTALDNYIINNMLQTTQREIIFALGETIESHYEETGSHVQRVAKMMYNFAILNKYTGAEADILALASSMHDLGKIAIPEAILKKPERITEEEYDIIKTHTTHGHKILSNSSLPALILADEIAFNHHEKYNGTGYPRNIQGADIPLSARMMAIIDVFDALTHKRVYKDAMSIADALDYIRSEKGEHFDPYLVDLFINNLGTILKDI
jgi:response regulator RpfG family c-di-GMP phosphodiesterase